MKRRTARAAARMHEQQPAPDGEVTALRAEIVAAWADAAAPGSIPAHCQRPDCPAIAAYFSGRTWEEVDVRHAARAAGASSDNPLLFLPPAAAQYFLAAYLLAFVSDPASLGNFYLPRTLCPDSGWRDRVEGLTRGQRRAVLSFLTYAKRVGHSHQVLDDGIQFWEGRVAR